MAIFVRCIDNTLAADVLVVGEIYDVMHINERALHPIHKSDARSRSESRPVFYFPIRISLAILLRTLICHA
jgi:hypothetical protein